MVNGTVGNPMDLPVQTGSWLEQIFTTHGR